MQIIHRCGHTQNHEIYGNATSKSSRVAYLKTIDCSTCIRKSQNASAAIINQDADLPALIGTDKQIAWAESIRAKIIREATEYLAKTESYTPASPAEATEIEKIIGAIADLKEKISAAWWITNQYGLKTALKAVLEGK